MCLRWLPLHVLSVSCKSRESRVCFLLLCIFYWVHSVERASKIKSILSIIFQALNGTLCIRFIHSLMMIVRIGVLYLNIIKSEVWPIRYCLGLDNEIMVCFICLYILIIYIYIIYLYIFVATSEKRIFYILCSSLIFSDLPRSISKKIFEM